MTDEPGFYCLPLSADIDTVAGVREAIPPPECGSVSDEFCDMVCASLGLFAQSMKLQTDCVE